MPLLDTDTLIKQYYETIKDRYPDITHDRLSKILKAPFWFFKKSMEREDMPIILIKFLGKFRVYSGKIKTLMVTNSTNLKYGHISVTEYERRRNIYLIMYNKLLEDEKKDTEID